MVTHACLRRVQSRLSPLSRDSIQQFTIVMFIEQRDNRRDNGYAGPLRDGSVSFVRLYVNDVQVTTGQ